MLQSKTDNPLDGLHLETYVRADADGVASCAAGLLAARCAEAVSRRGVFTLALSGGSTPLTLFRLLRTEAWAARVDWAHTRVFWVDERCVAPDHPASNYGAANQELLAHVPAAEIYRRYIPEIGGNSETVCIPAKGADRLREGWERNGKGWVTETMPSKLPGCVNVILYYGSSTYDTAQMSRLISLAVQDCREQGVETMPPQELAAMMEGWNAQADKGSGDPA